MTLPAFAPHAFPVFVHGLALSFGLIVAIGAQNAFVLRQGLRREHVGSEYIGWLHFQPIWEQLEATQPDMFS